MIDPVESKNCRSSTWHCYDLYVTLTLFIEPYSVRAVTESRSPLHDLAVTSTWFFCDLFKMALFIFQSLIPYSVRAVTESRSPLHDFVINPTWPCCDLYMTLALFIFQSLILYSVRAVTESRSRGSDINVSVAITTICVRTASGGGDPRVTIATNTTSRNTRATWVHQLSYAWLDGGCVFLKQQ